MAERRQPRRSPLDAWCAERLGVDRAALDRAAVEGSQLERFQLTYEWARRKSPFYRRRLSEPTPDSLEAVSRVPFTTPGDLRASAAQLLCVSQDEIHRVVTLHSSGTTGPSKRVFFSREEQAAIVDFFRAGMSTFVEPGERVVIFLPGPVEGSVGALLAVALERLGATPVLHSFVRDVRAAVEALASDRPTSLVALPVHALALARWVTESAPGRVKLKAALLTADHVPQSLVRQVERGLGCEVFEHYGMTEMGLGGAVECEAHEGYHLREADLLFEVVDPETGAPAAEGALGEVVFTTLTRRAMPLIRYRTRDLARRLPGPCACGSVMSRLTRVRGRLSGAEVSHPTLPVLDELLFACPGVVDFSAEVSHGRLRLTAYALSHPSEEMIRALEEARQAIPEALIAYASLDGRLESGPAKRAVAVRQEGGDGQ